VNAADPNPRKVVGRSRLPVLFGAMVAVIAAVIALLSLLQTSLLCGVASIRGCLRWLLKGTTRPGWSGQLRAFSDQVAYPEFLKRFRHSVGV